MEYPNRVKDTTTTEGTGNITVAGAPPATYVALSAKVANGKKFPYGLFHRALNEWEIGIGTMLTAETFSRAPSDSSNGGALVNFSVGTKDVMCVVSGADFASIERTTQIPFATAIPFDAPGHAYMADKTVTGALTFTAVAGAVRGALVYLRLTADGVNAPNFSAFKEWGGSSGYDNRNGIVNQVQFFCDGADLFYSASQAVGATPAAVPDTTAPTLTSPSGTQTGTTTATVSVTTNEANGTLYALVTTNATETAATIKASGATQAITSTGSKSFNITGLTASTSYFSHFVHRDAAGNDSAVANGSGFTTAAVGDTTAPTLSAPTATKTGANTATGGVTTNEAGGTLYYMASTNATETAATVKAGASQAVTATGAQAVSFTGLPAASTLYGHYLHRDAAGNDSTVANSGSFITDASGGTTTKARLTQLVSLAESGTAPDYEYTGTGGGYNQTPIGGLADKTLPGDGRVIVKSIALNGAQPMLGLHDQAGLYHYAYMPVNLFANATGYTQLGINNSTYPVTMVTTGVIPANTDWWSILKVGTVAYAEVSKDSGATWTRIFSVSGVTSAVSKIQVRTEGTAKFSTPFGTGLA